MNPTEHMCVTVFVAPVERAVKIRTAKGADRLLPRDGMEGRVMSTQALTGDEICELYRKRAPRHDVTSQVMVERYLGTPYIAAGEKAGGAGVGNGETRS